MKVSAASLVLTAILLSVARADLTVIQKVEEGGSVREMTTKVRGDKVRLEVTPQITTIMNSKSGETLTLLNDQKKFIRIDAEKTKAILGMASKYTGTSTEKPKLTPTGKKDKVNGYDVEEYVSETPSFKASYWIASNYPDSARIMKQLQAMTSAAWMGIAKGTLDYRDFPGIPLRTQATLEGKEIMTTITAIKQDALTEEDFSTPEDFQEMKMPKLEGMTGAKPSPAPSSNP
jgi:hypothetical protein